MNELTTFGPVRDVAELALDAIHEVRSHVADRNTIGENALLALEDRWLALVRTPGGSHFPSRSSSAEGDDR